MKKTLILCTFLVGFSAFSFTKKDSLSSFTFQRLAMMENFDCDACGCSASGGSMGFSSMLNNNFIGVRYFKQSYTSRDGIFANSPWIDENFITARLIVCAQFLANHDPKLHFCYVLCICLYQILYH